MTCPKVQAKKVDEQVGERVCQLRLANGMSGKKLGEVLDVTFQQVQKYEKGANRLSAGKLFLIAQYFEVDVSWFYAGIEGNKGIVPDAECLVLAKLLQNLGKKQSKALGTLIAAIGAQGGW